MPPLLPIKPFTRPVRGEAVFPGSKSITNRALMLAALCDGPVTLTNALFSEDSLLMATALGALGIDVALDPKAQTMRVAGKGGSIPSKSAKLSVGLAGTAARFLAALCAAAPGGIFQIDGVPQMRRRPMKGLIEALRVMGADVRCTGEEGFFPLEIHARGLKGGQVGIDASESSQMLSALLMVAPLAQSDTVVQLSARVREPFVEMTTRLMRQFGVEVNSEKGGYTIPHGLGYHLRGAAAYPVEPDATAASYFIALPLVTGGSLKLSRVLPAPDSLQGDIAFADVMKETGLSIGMDPSGLSVSLPPGVRACGIKRDFRNFSDTFLTLAALAPLLAGPTRISGIAHTRRQETDRVSGMARELRKLGQEVVETEDSLEISPRPIPASGTAIEIETYGDHRFAMSFGILGCRDLRGDGRPWLAIQDPACVAKTFPGFFDLLESLRLNSLEA